MSKNQTEDMNSVDENQENGGSSDKISISELSKRGYQLLKENYIDEL